MKLVFLLPRSKMKMALLLLPKMMQILLPLRVPPIQILLLLLLLPKMKMAFLLLPEMKMSGLSKIHVSLVFIFHKHSILNKKYLRINFEFKFKFKFPAFLQKKSPAPGTFPAIEKLNE